MVIIFNDLCILIGRGYWIIQRFFFNCIIDSEIEKWSLNKNKIIRNYKNGLDISDITNQKVGSNGIEIIGQIDELGRVLTEYEIKDRVKVSKEKFIKRRKNDIYIISFKGKAAIKKDYRKNKYSFLKELRGLHLSSISGSNVSIILDVDFTDFFIIFSYIGGTPLIDLALNKISAQKLEEKIYKQVQLIHEQGIYLNDLTASNIIITPDFSTYVIDFEMSAHKKELGIFFRIFTEIEKLSIPGLFK